MTDIKVGDRYIFNGLEGQSHHLHRTITVFCITVSGEVTFRIDALDADGTDPVPENLYSAPLSEVLLMISRSIWVRRA